MFTYTIKLLLHWILVQPVTSTFVIISITINITITYQYYDMPSLEL